MLIIDTELLINVHKDSLRLNLDIEFIEIIEAELIMRGVLVGTTNV